MVEILENFKNFRNSGEVVVWSCSACVSMYVKDTFQLQSLLLFFSLDLIYSFASKTQQPGLKITLGVCVCVMFWYSAVGTGHTQRTRRNFEAFSVVVFVVAVDQLRLRVVLWENWELPCTDATCGWRALKQQMLVERRGRKNSSKQCFYELSSCLLSCALSSCLLSTCFMSSSCPLSARHYLFVSFSLVCFCLHFYPRLLFSPPFHLFPSSTLVSSSPVSFHLLFFCPIFSLLVSSPTLVPSPLVFSWSFSSCLLPACLISPFLLLHCLFSTSLSSFCLLSSLVSYPSSLLVSVYLIFSSLLLPPFHLFPLSLLLSCTCVLSFSASLIFPCLHSFHLLSPCPLASGLFCLFSFVCTCVLFSCLLSFLVSFSFFPLASFTFSSPTGVLSFCFLSSPRFLAFHFLSS